jgi:hypothetical protein
MMILYGPPHLPITRATHPQVKYRNFLFHKTDITLFELKCLLHAKVEQGLCLLLTQATIERNFCLLLAQMLVE